MATKLARQMALKKKLEEEYRLANEILNDRSKLTPIRKYHPMQFDFDAKSRYSAIEIRGRRSVFVEEEEIRNVADDNEERKRIKREEKMAKKRELDERLLREEEERLKREEEERKKRELEERLNVEKEERRKKEELRRKKIVEKVICSDDLPQRIVLGVRAMIKLLTPAESLYHNVLPME